MYKPILFNTEMVKAILEGRKTVTRRLLKRPFEIHENGYITKPKGNERLCPYEPPYSIGDVMWVRETFCPNYFDECITRQKAGNSNAYKVDYNKSIVGDIVPEPKWKPSIHMPKSAARIFLKVTDVRVEKVQDVDRLWSNYEKEGVREPTQNISIEMKNRFVKLWDSTTKEEQYKFASNPYVWVIEFERCEKPEDF